MVFSLLLSYFIFIVPVLVSYLALLATLRVTKSQGAFKIDKLLIFTVLVVIANYLAAFALTALKTDGLLQTVISAMITFLVAYFLAKEYFKIEQKRAVSFGIYFVIFSLVISIVFGLLLYVVGISVFNYNFS